MNVFCDWSRIIQKSESEWNLTVLCSAPFLDASLWRLPHVWENDAISSGQPTQHMYFYSNEAIPLSFSQWSITTSSPYGAISGRGFYINMILYKQKLIHIILEYKNTWAFQLTMPFQASNINKTKRRAKSERQIREIE